MASTLPPSDDWCNDTATIQLETLRQVGRATTGKGRIMRRFGAVIVASCMLGGCFSSSSSSNTDFAMQEVAKFVPGTTTKADVITTLGKPLAVDRLDFGEMWTYSQSTAASSTFGMKFAIRQKSAFVSFKGDKLLTASWQITNTETGPGGGGTQISEAEVGQLKQQGAVTQDVVRQRFGEPQQRMWHLDGKQQWGYIAVGFAGANPKFNRFDFAADGTLNKVAMLAE